MAVMIKIVVFQVVMPCSFVGGYRYLYFNPEPMNFNLEDEGKMYLRNVAIHPQNYMM
jgi:hypothetical protein